MESLLLQNHDFYLTVEHPCSYFDERLSQNIIPDPNQPMTARLYQQLGMIGFRRSGDYVYRPHCKGCSACVAARIYVERFSPSRSQRRCLKRNQQVEVKAVAATFSEEYFALYRDYLNQRHADGLMKDPSEDDFKNFLISDWCDTFFLEFREHGELLAVAVIDRLGNGLSAVYTFFHPDMSSRGLGTLAILKQIEYCREQDLPFLYLGYWIEGHPKMDYKANFSGLEIFLDNHWLQFKRS